MEWFRQYRTYWKPEVARFSDSRGYFPGANLGSSLESLYNTAAMEEMYGRKLATEAQSNFQDAYKQAPNMAAMGIKNPQVAKSLEPFNQMVAPPSFKPSGLAEAFGGHQLAKRQSADMVRLMEDVKKHNEPGFWEKYGQIIMNLAIAFGPGLVGGWFGGGGGAAASGGAGVGGAQVPAYA